MFIAGEDVPLVHGLPNSFPFPAVQDVPPEKALFSEVDAAVAGLANFKNEYSDPDVWNRRWREYINGTIGVGLALGDIDGDRLPDIFLVSKNEESRLYRNLGDFKFEDVSQSSGFVDSPDPASGAAFADVDNDGDLDLYLCYVAGKNELWINDGSGRFSNQAKAWGVDISNGCTMASFADFDRDGDLDFYLQNNLLHFEDNFVKLADQLFENRGDHFVEITEKSGITGKGHGHSAVWWDFNEDGWPDIYVANDFDDLDKLYRNNRDGTFTDVISKVSPQAPYFSMGADFGDINNDGHSDFWVADMATTTREKHMRTVGNNIYAYKIGGESETHQYLKNVLLLKLSANQFAEIAFMAGLARTDWTWAARLVDLNNDGWLDAFASNGMLRSFHETDIISRAGKASVANEMAVLFRNEPILKEANLVFENLKNLQFANRNESWGLGKIGVSFGAGFADLDLDGDLDLVLNNFGEPVSVYRNNDRVGNRITLRLIGSASNRFGIGAKVIVQSGTLVQTKELASMRGYMSTDPPILHFGLGNSSTVDRLEIFWPSGISQVHENLEINRFYEIVEEVPQQPADLAEEAKTLFRPSSITLPEIAKREEAYFNDFKFQPLLPFRESRLGGMVGMGDLNNDGKLDLVLSGSVGQSTLVLLNKGGESFESSTSFDLDEDFGSENWDLELTDWEGDGDLDLLVASGGVELEAGDPFLGDALYLNDGAGEMMRDFEIRFSLELSSSSALAAADFDRDGDKDVFVGSRTVPQHYPHSGRSRLWRNVNGQVESVEDLLAPGLADVGRVTAADWVDMDGNGYLDLILSREWDTPIIFKGSSGTLKKSVSDFDPSLHSGLWSCQAIADLDGDGLRDIVAGNLGLNTEYRASTAEPVRLWYSGKDVSTQLIETHMVEGVEWTREVMLRLEKSLPRELRKVRSFDQYAGMNFGELFPDVRDQGFDLKSANELRSGIFWQNRDGTFSFEPLPSFAQSGRAMDLLLEDVNADGRKDILMSLELVSPEPWSERFEKGHVGLFLNQGERSFETVLPWSSGLDFQGSPRGLGWGDLDDDDSPELIIVLSEGMPLVFSLSETDER